MSYFAVAYSEWSSMGYEPVLDGDGNQKADESGQLLWRACVCMDGSDARMAGPFKKAKHAWGWVCKHQSRSMRASWPFVFKSSATSVSAGLLRMIEDGSCQETNRRGLTVIKPKNSYRLCNKKARKGGFDYRRWHRCP